MGRATIEEYDRSSELTTDSRQEGFFAIFAIHSLIQRSKQLGIPEAKYGHNIRSFLDGSLHSIEAFAQIDTFRLIVHQKHLSNAAYLG